MTIVPIIGTIAPVLGTNSTIDILGSALFGKTRKSILALFFTNIESSFYLRQITQISGCGMGAVQRELTNLTNAGILKRKEVGRHVYFQVNKSCPIYNELMNIVKKTSGLAGLIKQALVPLMDQLRIVFIYGSFAKTCQTPESDIDLFIIGDAVFSDIVEALETTQQNLQREINPTIFSEVEFREKLKEGNHFLNSILRGEKLFVTGDDSEFAAMVK